MKTTLLSVVFFLQYAHRAELKLHIKEAVSRRLIGTKGFSLVTQQLQHTTLSVR